MTIRPGSPSSVLGAQLAGALDRRLQSSLNSLVSLRDAVRVYTIHERDRGVSLETIVKQALTTLTHAEDGRDGSSNGGTMRDSDLARHLETWCREDFGSPA